jgi:hypothetical protein
VTGPRGPRSQASIHALRGAMRAVDPAAVVASPRVLRRLHRRVHRLRSALVVVPHAESMTIGREELLRAARPSEIGLSAAELQMLPEAVHLVAAPDARELHRRDAAFLLRDLWRRLVHLRIHAVLEGPPGVLDLAVGAAAEALGAGGVRCVAGVLAEEARLAPPHNLRHEMIELAALWVELGVFDPARRGRLFAAVEGAAAEAVARLAPALDAEGIVAACRPAGAAGPSDPEEGPEEGPAEVVVATAARPGHGARLLRAAERAWRRGNHVRAAFCHQRRSGGRDPDPEAARALAALAARLRSALPEAFDAEAELAASLAALLATGARRAISPEFRLLYDLQKLALDHERGLLEADLFRWIRSRGRWPWQFPLPHLREVRARRRLAAARRRLARVQAQAAVRARLDALLAKADRAADRTLRARLRPPIELALDGAGLLPRSVPEQVARRKLADELLDRAAGQGFFTLLDLRDAVSRSQLKIADCKGVAAYRSAGGLLRADQGLARELPELYRPGEFYLRSLLRVSTLAFGTRTGRRLMTFVVVPFGAAFTTLFAVREVLHLVAPDSASAALTRPLPVLLLGVYLMGLLKSTRVQAWSRGLLRGLLRLLRLLLVGLPRWVLDRELLRRMRESRAWRLAWRHGLTPGLAALAAALLVRAQGASGALSALSAAVGFGATHLLLDSRLGVSLEERIAEAGSRAWDGVRRTVLVGLFRLFVAVFEQALDAMERGLYAVDEGLRFRTGERGPRLVVKAALGTIWRTLRYVIRFYVTLLVEPQVNPIKHFPVVTVSHKLMLPFWPVMTATLTGLFVPVLGTVLGTAFAGATVFLSPGLFGFMVWELKENWRLFRANRAPELRPVRIGHHGETMARLLRPGFHSGTLPKLHHRCRRLEARGHAAPERRVARLRAAIHHAEETVALFFEREVLALLEAAAVLAPGTGQVTRVRGGASSIEVRLALGPDPKAELALRFVEKSGFLLLSGEGSSIGLDPVGREAVRVILLGAAKLAAVDLLQTDLERALAPGPPPYDLCDDGLAVWLHGLAAAPGIHRLAPGLRGASGTARFVEEVLAFRRSPLRWAAWEAGWDRLSQGLFPIEPLLPGIRVDARRA